MNIKPGKQTTEFWVTAITNLINAILMIVVALGLLTQEQMELWQGLLGGLVLAVLPIVTMLVNREYTKGRTAVKLAAVTPAMPYEAK